MTNPDSNGTHGCYRGQRSAVSGQVMIIFALATFVLVGFVALSIDAGFLMAERRQVQNAADAAALAAAVSIQDSMSSGDVTSAAVAYAASNAGVSSGDVVVSWPPTSGAYSGDDNYVQVTVEKDVDRFFIGAVYSGPWEVSASAVAGIEPKGFDAALLALNSNAGGIVTGGSTNIHVEGGSVVSNYNINTNGSTSITADQAVVANDGFSEHGSSTVEGGEDTQEYGPEVPDPLLDKISPPTVPAIPGNPVATVSPPSGSCTTYSNGTVPSSTYTSGGSGCVDVHNVSGGNSVRFTSNGQFRFRNGTGISTGGSNGGQIILQGGTYNFEGNGGISVGGSTNYFEMQSGNYAFTGGAGINIGGSALDIRFGGGTYYFSGGGGIQTGGSNNVIIGPGTYIFNGGTGFRMSGSSTLTFLPGSYDFYFANGADFNFEGSSRIINPGSNVYVNASFIGASGSGWSDLSMSGSTSFELPAGEYLFDHGRFLNSGSSTIAGDDIFLYFCDGGYLSSTGSSRFGFTAPTDVIYPGYFPGVFMYSDRANTATFTWQGSTSAVSKGTVYLPSSPVQFGGSSTGKQFEGQFIADRFITSGSTGLTLKFVEYVQTEIPKIYLVN